MGLAVRAGKDVARAIKQCKLDGPKPKPNPLGI